MRSPRLPTIEPQRRAGVGNSETVLRNRRRVGGDWLEVGIDARARAGQPSARIVEARLGNTLTQRR